MVHLYACLQVDCLHTTIKWYTIRVAYWKPKMISGWIKERSNKAIGTSLQPVLDLWPTHWYQFCVYTHSPHNRVCSSCEMWGSMQVFSREKEKGISVMNGEGGIWRFAASKKKKQSCSTCFELSAGQIYEDILLCCSIQSLPRLLFVIHITKTGIWTLKRI